MKQMQCQNNLYGQGYQIVNFDDIADIYIVNTCTVTNMSDRKTRQMLRRVKKQNPNAILVAVRMLRTGGKRRIKKNSGN